MTQLRLSDAEDARIEALGTAHNKARYAVLKRLVQLGLERVEAGDPLFGASPIRRFEELALELEERLDQVLEQLARARGRELNLGLEAMEQTIWLRIVGEVLRPGGQAEVNERLQKHARRILKAFHLPPPEAPAKD